MIRLTCLAAAMCLAACATGHLTPAQTAENADTAADLAYAATASAVIAYEQAGGSAVRGDALRTTAWQLLLQERALYKAGLDVSVVVGQLQALETQAKGLK